MTKYIEQFWRAAKHDDALRVPPMVARFRSSASEQWTIGTLQGYRTIRHRWCMDSDIGIWAADCEVYDEPDWHKNKPEPGEGYRLLQKFPKPEELLETDECFYPRGTWSPTNQHKIGQAEHIWYRRKIEPVAAVEEQIKFVAHPIHREKGKWLFKGRPIQDRSYAVLNEQGQYLQWQAGSSPEYLPEFRQAFTPSQLLQVSVRELGRNIHLRAVEPVDVNKLKREVRQELQPKAVETKPTYEIGKVCACGGRKFRLATNEDIGKKVYRTDGSLEYAIAVAPCVLESIQRLSNGALQYSSRGFWKYAFIEITEPQEPKYVPFEWEDRHLLRHRYVRRKGELYRESYVQEIDQLPDGTCVGRLPGSIYAFQQLLEMCEFEDGTPCGKRVDQ